MFTTTTIDDRWKQAVAMLLFAALFHRAEQMILEAMPSFLQKNHVNALNKIKGMPVRARFSWWR